MANSFQYSDVDILFAEDDPAFVEITTQAFSRAGLNREKVHHAEDGCKALDLFQKFLGESSRTLPLLVILDVRMPGMHGNTCASRMRVLETQLKTSRPAFMVCCSAFITKVSTDCTNSYGIENASVFNAMFPKPFGKGEVEIVMSMFKDWMIKQQTEGYSLQAVETVSKLPEAPETETAPEHNASGLEVVDSKTVDIVIADSEMICRMGIVLQLNRLELTDDSIFEAETVEETVDVIAKAQARSPPRPIMVMLGVPAWLTRITEVADQRNKPFLVCTSVSERRESAFQATLPRSFQQEHLKDLLERCQRWWQDQAIS
jgi:CheY-like chemotaxis protein